jgi:hypothetical protein
MRVKSVGNGYVEGHFRLVHEGVLADFLIAEADHEVVKIVARTFAPEEAEDQEGLGPTTHRSGWSIRAFSLTRSSWMPGESSSPTWVAPRLGFLQKGGR